MCRRFKQYTDQTVHFDLSLGYTRLAGKPFLLAVSISTLSILQYHWTIWMIPVKSAEDEQDVNNLQSYEVSKLKRWSIISPLLVMHIKVMHCQIYTS